MIPKTIFGLPAPFTPPEWQEKREDWFSDWQKETATQDQQHVLGFHKNAGEGNPSFDLVMNRKNIVRTVSITSIIKNIGAMEMRYEDILAKEIIEEKLAIGQRLTAETWKFDNQKVVINSFSNIYAPTVRPQPLADSPLITTLMTSKTIINWALRIIPAVILLQTLFFKFTGAPESVYIFETLGMEPVGRIGSGIAELIAAVLLLLPKTTWIGAILGLGVMAGAIMSHLTKLGIEVQGDGGLLFGLAVVTFICCGILAWQNREQVPVLKNMV